MTEPSRPRSGWLARPASVLGWAALASGLLGLAARESTPSWQYAIVAASFSVYLMLGGAMVGLLLLAWRRSWIGVAVAVSLVLATVVVQLPMYVGRTPAPGLPLVLLQANLRLGHADPSSIVDRVRSSQVDLLTVEELTPPEVTALTAAGLTSELPYRLVAPYPGGAGTGIWSRYPLVDPGRVSSFTFQVLTSDVALPGAGRVQIFALHLVPPWPYPAHTWRSEISRLRTVLGETARQRSTVIAAGDFNATLDNAPLRRLLGNDYRDAAEESGAGFSPTYPADRFFPPLITIDHVLLHGAVAASVATVRLPGSDHRGVLAHLTVAHA